ncbi:Fructose-1,6-bisphosphatase class 1 [Grimontia hollisae]|nr:Fructose-1,6-bisphosphatase class 1 [Grimontia hollisae]
MRTGTTFTRLIIEDLRKLPEATGDFTLLLSAIVTACKEIADDVSRGQLINVLGSAETENIQGETQKKLDVISNEILIHALEWSGHLSGMASEEMEDIYPVPARFPKGKYLLVFDPLDGSSNTEVNVSIGTFSQFCAAPPVSQNPRKMIFCSRERSKCVLAMSFMAQQPIWCSQQARVSMVSRWTGTSASLF